MWWRMVCGLNCRFPMCFANLRRGSLSISCRATVVAQPCPLAKLFGFPGSAMRGVPRLHGVSDKRGMVRWLVAQCANRYSKQLTFGATGFEPAASCSQSGESPVQKPAPDAQDTVSEPVETARCTERCTPLPEAASDDSDLTAVVTAWPTLPEHIRAAIRTLVEPASGA